MGFSAIRASLVNNSVATLAGAAAVYAKSWASLGDWGDAETESARRAGLRDWCVTNDWLARTPDARFMHCLPVRRNVVVADEVLDGPRSVVIDQAENRLHAQTAVLEEVFAGHGGAAPAAKPAERDPMEVSR